MNQRNFLNLGLALALIVLVAVLAFEPGKKILEKAVLLTQLTPTDIQKIAIEQNSQHTIILSKIDNQWQMSKPYNNQANTLSIKKLLALASAKSHAQYPVTDIKLKQLKLSTPDLTITLNKTKLIFGTTDAIKGYRYIQINNAVHLITDRYSHLVRGQASKLLSPALLPKGTAITRLVLPELTLQTNETGWKITPDNKSISADQVQQFLDQWRFSRAIRVTKITANADKKAARNKRTSIEVYSDESKLILFDLTQTEDEIILQRPDTGLQYHFTVEAGERLLKPLTTNEDSPNPT